MSFPDLNNISTLLSALHDHKQHCALFLRMGRRLRRSVNFIITFFQSSLLWNTWSLLIVLWLSIMMTYFMEKLITSTTKFPNQTFIFFKNIWFNKLLFFLNSILFSLMFLFKISSSFLMTELIIVWWFCAKIHSMVKSFTERLMTRWTWISTL